MSARINLHVYLQDVEAEGTQMRRDEILNDNVFTMNCYGGSLYSRQSINMADSPEATFVRVCTGRSTREILAWDAVFMDRINRDKIRTLVWK